MQYNVVMENESDADISISSWKTEDMNSDADEFKNNVNQFTLDEITTGACGEKYKLKLQDKCFLKNILLMTMIISQNKH